MTVQKKDVSIIKYHQLSLLPRSFVQSQPETVSSPLSFCVTVTVACRRFELRGTKSICSDEIGGCDKAMAIYHLCIMSGPSKTHVCVLERQ